MIGSKEMEEQSVTIKLLEKREQVNIPVADMVAFLDRQLVEEEEEHHHHHHEHEEE